MDVRVKQLLEELDAEREYLDRRGYSFPALFDAVKFLLEHTQILIDTSDDV